MTWRNTSTADITAQSDADGYNESVTVEDGETVHVDTHAEASTSATPSTVVFDNWSTQGWGKEEKNKEILTFRNVNGIQNVSYTLKAYEYLSDGVTLSLYNQSGNKIDEVYAYDETKSTSGTGTIGGVKSHIDTGTASTGDFHTNFNYGLRLEKNVSATVDSKSVVTEDIHK